MPSSSVGKKGDDRANKKTVMYLVIYHCGVGWGSDALLGKVGSLIKQFIHPKLQGHYYTAMNGQTQKLSDQALYTVSLLDFFMLRYL